ncbi:MAG: ribonuclease E/G, partial [Proteobacteria bacterium]|nr:ribonuclease E/G [Pseudomonadota bacterium]
KVYAAMQEGLKKDRSITRISEISELGLLEMTRKRIRSSITEAMCNPCEVCEGKGYIKSKESISYEILRTIDREVHSCLHTGQDVKVHVHPTLSDILLGPLAGDINELEIEHSVSIEIKSNPSLHLEDYHIH